ncbi:MAG: hypothetical protein JKY50_15800 [Oleispira sp.]|nr:hypothetical protein [Oleispira sp.]MBL4882617.1 hypothetical protein [Oleispira sp.]
MFIVNVKVVEFLDMLVLLMKIEKHLMLAKPASIRCSWQVIARRAVDGFSWFINK